MDQILADLVGIALLALMVAMGFVVGFRHGAARKRQNSYDLDIFIVWNSLKQMETAGEPIWGLALAEKSGVSVTIAYSHLRHLERMGILESHEELSVPGGRVPRRFYHISDDYKGVSA